MKLRFDRRRFLRGTFGSLGTVILARVGWLFPEARQAFTNLTTTIPLAVDSRKPTLEEVGGELYADFVLLPEGAPVPDIVQDYKFGIPAMCGVSDGGKSPAYPELAGAVHIDLPNAKDLATRGGFPVYTLGKLTHGLRPSGTSLIKHGTGEVFGGWVTFEAQDREANTWYTAVSILVQADFPKPFPLWSSNPVEEGGPAVTLEKVNFLPGGPGILIHTPVGFTLHWIQRDVFYTMSVEHLPGAEAQAFASALTLVA